MPPPPQCLATTAAEMTALVLLVSRPLRVDSTSSAHVTAVIHGWLFGNEHRVPGLGGTAVIGVVACWMSGLGRGSHGDRRIRMTQISLLQSLERF